ncbi:MAG: hypothetical protein COW16_01295 [Sphingomonadales bacterium CG12_big_fil_rev_8_21_14_0_65_65_10]|uniref:Uncharacterized protein n=1 Tax=Blastomonas marina TaxID=1867408 RepID=A0ABQ1FBE1_9SPHN|nr:hypothetical protein [Blastomonas marina]PIW56355.1 MAG: hypothetical protein COW16_01295 [Sphingomonadales bacterium CG12_big_fil_rev_8_21_14_0_65_65_10]WPZ04907.1 hypothetical protein T8S45_05040 [Blastomonas marina]GGA04848.1 hypothetical protein GCM10010923_12940 [Blastomonas marina]
MDLKRLGRNTVAAIAVLVVSGTAMGAAQAQRQDAAGGDTITVLRKDETYTYFLHASNGAVRYCKLWEGYSPSITCTEWT